MAFVSSFRTFIQKNGNTYTGSFRGDRITGTTADDQIFGRAGNDDLSGAAGNDWLLGEEGRDGLSGGAGDDYLDGGADRDRIFGGKGRDWLVGGTGDDVLRGGEGDDIFFFNPDRAGEGHDVIRDFELGHDLIALNANDVIAATPGLAEAIIDGGGTVESVLVGLDESSDWNVKSVEKGLKIIHPTGKILLKGIDADVTSFTELGGALAVEGLGEALVGLEVEGRPESVAAVVAASGDGFDDDGTDFDSLFAALEATGLTPILADPEASFTVFAPNDDAFISLAQQLGYSGSDEEGAFEFIGLALTTIGDPTELLTNILTYHVLGEAKTFGELRADRTVQTLLEDAELIIEKDLVLDAEPDFKDAMVLASDVVTDNGVIQVISEVLLPVDL